jgi:hypothetical protein
MLQNAAPLTPLRRAPRPIRFVAERASQMNPWLLWRPQLPFQGQVLSVAELADCTCPELCNRDHANE